MIMLKYPSRSNLNCLFVVLRGLGRGCRILEPILDCRHPRDRENHYHLWVAVDSNHSREDLIYSQVAVSERLLLPIYTFLLDRLSVKPILYPEMESNHHHLYVRQIRSHYAIGANCTERWYRTILKIDMNHFRSLTPRHFGGHRFIIYSWVSTEPVEVIVGIEPT